MVKKLYENFEEIFCVVCMAVMVGCLSAQVLIRVTIGSSLAWTEELSRYAFLWAVYIGAALVAKKNGHVRITAQFLPFSLSVRYGMRVFTDAVWAVCTLYIAWQSWSVIKSGMDFPEISPTLQILKSYVEMIIPVGFVTMAWRIVEIHIRHCRQGTQFELVRNEVL